MRANPTPLVREASKASFSLVRELPVLNDSWTSSSPAGASLLRAIPPAPSALFAGTNSPSAPAPSSEGAREKGRAPESEDRERRSGTLVEESEAQKVCDAGDISNPLMEHSDRSGTSEFRAGAVGAVTGRISSLSTLEHWPLFSEWGEDQEWAEPLFPGPHRTPFGSPSPSPSPLRGSGEDRQALAQQRGAWQWQQRRSWSENSCWLGPECALVAPYRPWPGGQG
ncbi:uncharacterized protein LOC107514161 [Rousettus aegyptiacus]|uniref:uncharacterized protein LOC107514161 n=1 Tax=Rousettus aegyptiacus TaxID=9407 RepID=UPI00168D5BD9|nr:uncharacterized protein LOC107514161 [Rousettus aegyptiacus]